MPAVSAPATVLVTGANGYIATHLVKEYLDASFTVVGTVRKASSGEYLRKLYDAEHLGKFSYVLLEDLQVAGALDTLAREVDVIAHTAAPVVQPPGDFDPQLTIGPVVNGTLNVLQSAAVSGSRVRRVVITGTIGSVWQPHPAPYVYSDKDWNEWARDEIEKHGKQAPGLTKYLAAKMLGERAAWEFMVQHKPSYDLVYVLPTWTFGPVIHETSSLSNLSVSLSVFVRHFTHPEEGAPGGYPGFIDVRDVARMHVDATCRPDLAGRRLIAAAPQPVASQDFLDVYYSLPVSERPKMPEPVPRGQPGKGDKVRASLSSFTPESSWEVFQWETRSFPEVVKDTLCSLVDRGLLEK